eukprot:11473636-Alexandrium_andersonii.AAC.1
MWWTFTSPFTRVPTAACDRADHSECRDSIVDTSPGSGARYQHASSRGPRSACARIHKRSAVSELRRG